MKTGETRGQGNKGKHRKSLLMCIINSLRSVILNVATHLLCKYRPCFHLCNERERIDGSFISYITSSGTLCQLKSCVKKEMIEKRNEQKKKKRKKCPALKLLPTGWPPSFRFPHGNAFSVRVIVHFS